MARSVLVAAVLGPLVVLSACSPGGDDASTTDATGTVAAAIDDPTSTDLANGLGVRITPIAGAADVAVVLTFDVGSHHDPPGRSGLTHFAEHLLATSATSVEPARRVEELVAAYPLGWNAQTGSDYTVLATVVDPGDLDAELTRMAARLAGVTPTQVDVDRERPRILAEVDNMWAGIPTLAVVNAAKERVDPTPHGGRRGGDPAALATITLDELTDWLAFYNPANATLSIAGDVDPAAVATAVAERFGSVPAGVAAPDPVGPSSATPGITEVETDAPPDLVAVAYAPPAPDSADFLPFLVAVRRLFDADPEGELTVAYAPVDDPDALVVSAPLHVGERSDDGARRVAGEVARIVGTPLADGELDSTIDAFAPLLGLLPNRFNPYATAFAAARAEQLGLEDLADRPPADVEAADAIARLFVGTDLTGAAARPRSAGSAG